MEADPIQGSSAPKYQPPKHRFRSEPSDAVIDALYKLLSSGRPLSEVLDAAKQLKFDRDSRSETQPDRLEGKVRSAASPLKTASIDARVEPNFRASSRVLGHGTSIDAPRSPIGLKNQQAPKNAPFKKGWSRRLIGAALFGLIPTMSLALVGTTTTLLLDADLSRAAVEATAILRAIVIPVQLDRALTTSVVRSSEAGIAEPTPLAAAAIPIAPDLTGEQTETMHPIEQGVNRSPAEPATEGANSAQSNIQDVSLKPTAEVKNIALNPPASEVSLAAHEIKPEPAHAAEEAMTASTAEAVAKVATVQNEIHHSESLNVGTGKRTGRAWANSAQAKSTNKRRTRIKHRVRG